MQSVRLLILFLPFLISNSVNSQDSTRHSDISKIPSQYFDAVSKKANTLQQNLDKKSQKVLDKMQKQEIKLQKKLAKIDSLSTHNIFSNSAEKYAKFRNQLNTDVSKAEARISGEYLPYVDSLKVGMLFLNENKSLLANINSEKLEDAINNVTQLQNKIQQAEAIKQFIKQRREKIMEIMSRFTHIPKDIKKIMGNYSKEVYYYSQQVREYKEILNDPEKLEQKTLSLLNKLPAFQQFMKEHSELAGLFNLPGSYNSTQTLLGLQTKSQVQQLVMTQLGSGVNAGKVFGQQVQTAQSQLNKFKQKINALGGGSGDIDMPDFKPDNQKTKTFFKRLEYGANMQNTKASYFFPSTTDLGLSIGYRINDKSVVGIGGSYKIGWGKDIKHIKVTSQGISLRSFVDVKLKGNFFVSGGFEFNYQKAFSSIAQIHNLDAWQQSGLLGMSKIVSVKSKVFKKTRIQLLWDFLSYRQVPRTEPFNFRVGYNF